jgi:hypothetical protein
MRPSIRFLSAALASALLLGATQAGASLFDAFHPLDLQVTFTQPVLADGSVKLAPGTYDVHVTTSADGAVHADFLQGGVKRGEARGIIAVRKAGGEKTHSFRSLGFSSSSPSSLKFEGQKATLAIGTQGTNQILIGLQQPGATKLAPPPPGIVGGDLQGLKQQPNEGAQKVQPVGK